MKKVLFWTGISVLVIGLILFYLAGDPKIVPVIYNYTNQAYWLSLSLVGFILILTSFVIKFRKKKTTPIKIKKKKK